MRLTGLGVVLSLAAACGRPDAPAAGGAPVSAEGAASVPQPMPAAGDPAPDFDAVGHDGRRYQLSALRGRPVVVYFFPKADTGG